VLKSAGQQLEDLQPCQPCRFEGHTGASSILAVEVSLRISTSSEKYMKAKFWLDPVRLHSSGGFGRDEINRIQRLVEENREYLLRSWNAFFND